MNNYHIYEEIGHGQHSIVYKGRVKQSIQYVTIKSIDKRYKSMILNEVAVLYNLNHPNIVRFINWYETSKHIWLILEYCCGITLYHLIHTDVSPSSSPSYTPRILPEYTIFLFLYDMISALQYLHSRGFLYGGDLLSQYWLLNEYGHLKLIHFKETHNIMQLQHASKEQRTLIHSNANKDDDMDTNNDMDVKPLKSLDDQQLPNPPSHSFSYHRAPELLTTSTSRAHHHNNTTKLYGMTSISSDIYSLGCLLHELITGIPPYYKEIHQMENPRNNEEDVDNAIDYIYTHELPIITECSVELNDLLQKMLVKNPYKRITWDQIVHHPWFLQYYSHGDTDPASDSHNNSRHDETHHDVNLNDVPPLPVLTIPPQPLYDALQPYSEPYFNELYHNAGKADRMDTQQDDGRSVSHVIQEHSSTSMSSGGLHHNDAQTHTYPLGVSSSTPLPYRTDTSMSPSLDHLLPTYHNTPEKPTDLNHQHHNMTMVVNHHPTIKLSSHITHTDPLNTTSSTTHDQSILGDTELQGDEDGERDDEDTDEHQYDDETFDISMSQSVQGEPSAHRDPKEAGAVTSRPNRYTHDQLSDDISIHQSDHHKQPPTATTNLSTSAAAVTIRPSTTPFNHTTHSTPISSPSDNHMKRRATRLKHKLATLKEKYSHTQGKIHTLRDRRSMNQTTNPSFTALSPNNTTNKGIAVQSSDDLVFTHTTSTTHQPIRRSKTLEDHALLTYANKKNHNRSALQSPQTHRELISMKENQSSDTDVIVRQQHQNNHSEDHANEHNDVYPSKLMHNTTLINEFQLWNRSNPEIMKMIDTSYPAVRPVNDKEQLDIHSLLFHPTTDIHIIPLIHNPKIEKYISPEPLVTKELSFPPLTSIEILALPHSQLESLLTQIYQVMDDTTSSSSVRKLHTILYLQSVVIDPHIANLIINSTLMTQLLRMIHSSSSSVTNNPSYTRDAVLICNLLHCIGLLFRYATVITDHVFQSITPTPEGHENVTHLLTNLLRQSHHHEVQVKRRVVSGLCELLFYIATQPPAPHHDGNDDKKTKKNHNTLMNIPSSTIQLLLQYIDVHQDETICHYVCQCIQNIVSHMVEHIYIESSQQTHQPITVQQYVAYQWFVNDTTMSSLWTVAQNSKNTHIKRTCLISIGFLIQFDSSLAKISIEKIDKIMLMTLLNDNSWRVQQSISNIINICLIHGIPSIYETFCRDVNLLNTLLRYIVLPSTERHISHTTNSLDRLNGRGGVQGSSTGQHKHFTSAVKQVLRGKAILIFAQLLNTALLESSARTHTQNVSIPKPRKQRPSTAPTTKCTLVSKPSSTPATIILLIRYLLYACEQHHLSSSIDRCVSECTSSATPNKYQYTLQCISLLRTQLACACQWLIHECTVQINQYVTTRTQAHVSADNTRYIHELLQLYPLINKFITSSYCRPFILSSHTIIHLTQHIQLLYHLSIHATTPVTNHDTLSSLLSQCIVQMLESMKHHACDLLEIPIQYIFYFLSTLSMICMNSHTELLPHRTGASTIQSHDSLLFEYSTTFTDMVTTFMTQPTHYNPNESFHPPINTPHGNSDDREVADDHQLLQNGTTRSHTYKWNLLLSQWFSSTFPYLLQHSQQPLPQYLIRSASIILRIQPSFTHQLCRYHQNYIQLLLEFYNVHHVNNTVYLSQLWASIIEYIHQQQPSGISFPLEYTSFLNSSVQIFIHAINNHLEGYYESQLRILLSLLTTHGHHLCSNGSVVMKNHRIHTLFNQLTPHLFTMLSTPYLSSTTSSNTPEHHYNLLKHLIECLLSIYVLYPKHVEDCFTIQTVQHIVSTLYGVVNDQQSGIHMNTNVTETHHSAIEMLLAVLWLTTGTHNYHHHLRYHETLHDTLRTLQHRYTHSSGVLLNNVSPTVHHMINQQLQSHHNHSHLSSSLRVLCNLTVQQLINDIQRHTGVSMLKRSTG